MINFEYIPAYSFYIKKWCKICYIIARTVEMGLYLTCKLIV